jgi:hypothetical protein
MFFRLVGVTGSAIKHPHVPAAKRIQQQRTAGKNNRHAGACSVTPQTQELCGSAKRAALPSVASFR